MTSSPTLLPRASQRRSGDRASQRGWWFIGPFMLVFLVVFIAPVVYAIYLSFFRFQFIGGTQFVGIENYIGVFQDDRFLSAVGRVVLFSAVQVPVMLGISLFAALALDSGRLYGKNFFRLAVFLPYAVPGVVASLMWGFMYGPRFGLVNDFGNVFGVTLPDPFSSGLILPAIGNIVTWQFIGYNMLIFYAALRVIPMSLYEAAHIDGAGQFRVIKSIKLPAIRSALVIALIFSIIASFQLFNEPRILQTLAPNVVSSYFTPNLYAYSLAFQGQQQPYAATVAIVMGVFVSVIAYLIQARGTKRVMT
ncbi:carbohydrate ABC transporter permease [Mycetocola zhujimingii]|uniref:carbohydrate ABC transporter permease n=1 Tax=Mycetocola zhujimingii TaxID=2079792 RepID=UPI000D36F9E9|nr:sugar ABC transporter permease [Mycetocola zhujimingii]AWB85377.1 sugar ABC transporter permease [Mycetocola zhujimingii]